MKKLCGIGFVALAFCIAGSLSLAAKDKSLDCTKICNKIKSLQPSSNCKCPDEGASRGEMEIATHKILTKRDTQSQHSKTPIVGQSNPAAVHSRLIQQRARQRLHQQQQRAHLMTPPTHHRRLHHGHARQHNVTPLHHRPHLVGSVRERFGAGGDNKEQPERVLKRLRERQRQEKQEGGGKNGQAEAKAAGEEKQQREGGQVIITQAPDLIDGRR